MRALRPFELEFLTEAASRQDWSIGVEHLNEAFATEVSPEDLDYHHIRLTYPADTTVGKLWGLAREWTAEDSDEAAIEVLAFSDERGLLVELEIHRLDCRPMQRLPTLESAVPAGPR